MFRASLGYRQDPVRKRTRRMRLGELLREYDRRGKRVEVALVCNVDLLDDARRHNKMGLGDQIVLSCPNSTAARYVRRCLDELARKLDGMIVTDAGDPPPL